MKPQALLDFWFAPGMERRWFRSTAQLDAQIRERFEAAWRQAAQGAFDHWATSAEGALALVILLDQLPLNMYRGQPAAFATDARAIAVARRAIAAGLDRAMEKERRAFLYMPLMHSENLADQETSVRLYEAAGLEDSARFARHHRALIRRFGRFPHRNAILRRTSTAAEQDYLQSKEAFTG